MQLYFKAYFATFRTPPPPDNYCTVPKLKLEEGRITLPDPDTLTDGWEDNALNYPELCQVDVEKYWDESNLMSHTLFGTARGCRSAMVKY